ncbi:uncharacterized protein LOC128244855 [Mya arenaria]|uniref:uncharacterized protein LOC128244855 n=1 Tax=Mya arenaria TaxID=6604 RepID=UPI0022DEB9E4|nr:uncharacterized protein LOC128244855 [Mya arenaria]
MSYYAQQYDTGGGDSYQEPTDTQIETTSDPNQAYYDQSYYSEQSGYDQYQNQADPYGQYNANESYVENYDQQERAAGTSTSTDYYDYHTSQATEYPNYNSATNYQAGAGGGVASTSYQRGGRGQVYQARGRGTAVGRVAQSSRGRGRAQGRGDYGNNQQQFGRGNRGQHFGVGKNQQQYGNSVGQFGQAISSGVSMSSQSNRQYHNPSSTNKVGGQFGIKSPLKDSNQAATSISQMSNKPNSTDQTPGSSTVTEVKGTEVKGPEVKGAEDKATEVIEEPKEAESESSDEDTDFCKYCNKKFDSLKAYHAHTRGMQHTAFVMEAKRKKGDKKYDKEIVDKSVLEVQIPAPRPQNVEAEFKDEFEVEDNWMDLDNDMIDSIRMRKNIEERDLNPEQIGKSHLPDNYSCPLCEIRCTGAQAFRAHIDGKQHKHNLELAAKGVKVKAKKKQTSGIMIETEVEAKCMKTIQECPHPILGLDYVTEFQKSDPKVAPRYVCNLCEAKCDVSTIISHIVGSKHRLNLFKAKHPSIYEHLTKFNSKKKKSEINANCEMFAKDIYKKEGRGQVRVKIELDVDNDEKDFDNNMKRHAMALAEKASTLREIDTEEKTEIVMEEFRRKKRQERLEQSGDAPPRHGQVGAEDRGHWGPKRGRFEREDWGDDNSQDSFYETRYDQNRGRRYPKDDRPMHGRYGREPYQPDPYQSYDPYSREDFRVSYRERFDFHQHNDPYYERRMLDERRYLDSLMMERHRLADPYDERRRLDDVMARRKYLDSLEKDRLEDMIARRARLEQTEDIDLIRLRRFEERERQIGQRSGGMPEASRSPGLSSNERTRLEDQMKRRELMNIQSTAKDIMQDQSASLSLSGDPSVASRQRTDAARQLQEEAAKNPTVNVSEILQSLTSSMISSEDDAAMALQISNALTQSLLKYRLHNAPKELSSITDSLKDYLQPAEKPEPSSNIPGLGNSSSDKKVPSFLRQKAPTPKLAFSVKKDDKVVSGRNVFGPPSPSPPNSPTSISTAASVATTVVNTANTDQPQRMLLESIRKQTELIKQKIAASCVASTVPSSQQQTYPQSKQSQASTQPYEPSANQKQAVTSHITSAATSAHHSQASGHMAAASANQTQALSQVTFSSANQQAVQQGGPSDYSSYYYQQNFHMGVPNAAPQTASTSNPVQAPGMNTQSMGYKPSQQSYRR